MTYQDVSGSFVYLAGLVFLFICGMAGLMLLTLEAYKFIWKRLRKAEREMAAIDDAGNVLMFERSKLVD